MPNFASFSKQQLLKNLGWPDKGASRHFLKEGACKEDLLQKARIFLENFSMTISLVYWRRSGGRRVRKFVTRNQNDLN